MDKLLRNSILLVIAAIIFSFGSIVICDYFIYNEWTFSYVLQRMNGDWGLFIIFICNLIVITYAGLHYTKPHFEKGKNERQS